MKVFHFHSISSTNDYAKELLINENQVVVTADFQTKGRGRKERNWYGDYGTNLYMTYGINHTDIPDYQRLVLYQPIGCLAVIYVLEEITKTNKFVLKYPNDVYAKFETDDFRKICGVLIEHSFSGNVCKSSLIGIGLNVNQVIFPDDLKNFPTSLKLLGYDLEIADLVHLITEKIVKLSKKSNEELFLLWEQKLNIENKIISLLDSDSVWVALQLLNDGRVKLKDLQNNVEKIIDDGDTIRYRFE